MISAASFYTSKKLGLQGNSSSRSFSCYVADYSEGNDRVDRSVKLLCTSQEEAFCRFDELPNSMKNRCKVFTLENESENGKRMFLVQDVDSFSQDYGRQLPIHRHYYEIVRENHPCRLFFDLEFEIDPNAPYEKQMNRGEDALNIFLSLVQSKLVDLFDILITMDHVMILDSSTSQKYSKHVIIRVVPQNWVQAEGNVLLPPQHELFFHTVQDVQRFLLLLLDEINDASQYSSTASSPGNERPVFWPKKEYECLWFPVWSSLMNVTPPYSDLTTNSAGTSNLNREGGLVEDSCCSSSNQQNGIAQHRKFIVDLGVYTRNRSFRLWGSCKYGKEACFSLWIPHHSSWNRSLSISSTIHEILSQTYLVPMEAIDYEAASIEVHEKKLFSTNSVPLSSTITSKPLHSAIAYEFPSKRQIKYSQLSDVNSNRNDRKRKINNSPQKRENELENDGSQIISIYLTVSIHPTVPYSVADFQLSPNSSSSLLSRNYGDKSDHSSTFHWALDDRHMSSSMQILAECRSGSQGNHTMFPLLDRWILSHLPGLEDGQMQGDRINRYGPQIRGWKLWISGNQNAMSNSSVSSSHLNVVDNSMFSVSSGAVLRLQYGISNYRFCGNVGRWHRSNGIRMEVDVSGGWAFQTCWDPDCKGYRSPAIAVPQSVRVLGNPSHFPEYDTLINFLAFNFYFDIIAE